MIEQDVRWDLSGRKDTYEFRLVDPFSLNETGETLEAEYGASTVEFGYYTDNYRSASLQLLERPTFQRLIRVYHMCELPTGDTFTEVLGTFFLDEVKAHAEKGLMTYDAKCYGTWLRFTDDEMPRAGFFQGSDSRNASAYEKVLSLIAERGGQFRRVDGSDTLTSTTSVTWEVGDTVSSVLHACAAALNRKLIDDDNGWIVMDFIPNWSEAVSEYTFEEGKNCTYVGGYDASDSTPDKCNRVVRISSGEDYWYVGEAQLPETNEFAFENIGRYVTSAEELETETNTILCQQKANTYLNDNSGSIYYVEFEHVGIVGMRHGTAVTYINYTDSPINVKAFATQLSLTLGAGMPTKTKVKVI